MFEMDPKGYFCVDIFTVIQILQKFVIISSVTIRLLKMLAYATTAQLLSHVQNFVAIT